MRPRTLPASLTALLDMEDGQSLRAHLNAIKEAMERIDGQHTYWTHVDLEVGFISIARDGRIGGANG